MVDQLQDLRVVHVVDTLNVGGAEMLLTEFCRYQSSASINATVIALRPGTGNEVREALNALGIEVQIVATGHRRQMLDLSRIMKLRRIFRQKKFDVVHTHLRVATIFGGVAGKLAGIPVVCTLHNVRIDSGAGAVNCIKDFLETQVLRRIVSTVIACGPTVADSNAARIGSTPSVTVANPVREIADITAEERGHLRNEFLKGASGPLVLAVGRLTEQKGFDLLIDGFAGFVKKAPEARLLIVGEGKDRALLEARISEHNLQHCVILPGVRNDIPALLKSADLFVLSSRWEGLPLSLLEAMGAGLAVVATEVGDVSYAVGETGLIIPPNSYPAIQSALIKIASDQALVRSYRQDARKRVTSRHDPGRWVTRLRQVYDSVLERSASKNSNIV